MQSKWAQPTVEHSSKNRLPSARELELIRVRLGNSEQADSWQIDQRTKQLTAGGDTN